MKSNCRNAPANINDRPPNFRDENGKLFLVRCFACGEHGRENYAMVVAKGECAWCGWKEEVCDAREG
jgi:hypothetical protein